MAVTNKSLKNKIYEELLRMIIANKFPIDEFIVENQIVQMFGVSRSPVREALVELCNENILRNIPRAGYQIVKITGKQIRDAIQFRLLIEEEGIRTGFNRITDNDINSLKMLTLERNKRSKIEPLPLEEELKLNQKFHLLLNSYSKNVIMNKALENILTLLRRAIAQIIVFDNDIPQYEESLHSNIIKSLENKDVENAIFYLQKDIRVREKLFNEMI